MSSHERIIIHLNFNREEIVPSINHFFSHAEWFEREQASKLNLSFSNGSEILYQNQDLDSTLTSFPSLRRNPNKSEEPYPEERWIWKSYNFLSPYTRGLFNFQVCYDPSKVVDVRVQNGFFHKKIERLVENRSWDHVGRLIDPLMNNAGPSFSLIWFKIIEEFSEIKIPERAQALRIMILELNRIIEHLTVMSEMLRLMNFSQFRYVLDAREKMLELVEKYSGHRWGVFSIRLGGVNDDLPMGWLAEFQGISKIILKNLKIIHNSLFSSKDFKENLLGPIIDSRTILKWGVSGPAMRASGLNFDLRKSKPFYFYQDIDFDVPVGIYGTSYDRYLIRFEEIIQSFRILTQVLDNLPLGDFKVSDEVIEQDLVKTKSQISDKIWLYDSLEAPSGENGLLVSMQNHLCASSLKIKTSSFSITQALKEFLKGLGEDQLQVTIASLGLKKSEIDR